MCVSVGWRLTIGKVAVGARVDSVTERELDLLIGGKVEGMGRPRPHRQHVHTPDWPPHTLSPHNLSQGVHHVPVAGSWLRVQALHSSLG